MGLIIKDKIKQLIKGYPTVSDKYNVAGGILAGKNPVKFGDLVAYSEQTGYYEKAVGDAVPEHGFAGLVLATNVKLVTEWPGDVEAETKVGEAFNLLLDGYIAVQVTIASKNTENIAAGKPVYYKLGAEASDEIVLSTSDNGTAALDGYIFTGIYDEVDDTHVIAEIRVK